MTNDLATRCEQALGADVLIARMIEERVGWAKNAEETFAALKPQYDAWDKAKVTDPPGMNIPVNIYIVRLAIDHMHEAKKHRKEIAALECALAALRARAAKETP